MTRVPSTSRVSRRLIAALSLIAFVLGHQLVFVLTYRAGFGAALLRTGHEAQWAITVWSVGGFAIALGLFGARELWRLTRQARGLAGGEIPIAQASVGALLRDLFRLWLPVLVIGLALFVLYENAERLMNGLRAPGLGVLGSAGYQDTILVFEAVSFLVAMVAALYGWRRDWLILAIRAARRTWPRTLSRVVPSAERAPLTLDLVWLRPPGRAPPATASL